MNGRPLVFNFPTGHSKHSGKQDSWQRTEIQKVGAKSQWTKIIIQQQKMMMAKSMIVDGKPQLNSGTQIQEPYWLIFKDQWMFQAH